MSSNGRVLFFGSVLVVAGMIVLDRYLDSQKQDLDDQRKELDDQRQELDNQKRDLQNQRQDPDNKRQDLDFQTTFRVFLRPNRSEDTQISELNLKEQTEQLVRKAFDVEKNVQILIGSIVVDFFPNVQIGTLNFSKIPDSIGHTRTVQHTFLSSEKSPCMPVELDLDFFGLTQLSAGSLEPQSLE